MLCTSTGLPGKLYYGKIISFFFVQGQESTVSSSNAAAFFLYFLNVYMLFSFFLSGVFHRFNARKRNCAGLFGLKGPYLVLMN